MQLGNRIFPYPVLNHSSELSEYNSQSSFQLEMTLDENGEIIKNRNNVILKDIHFSLNDDFLQKLYDEKKLAVYLIVESSSAIYRKQYELTDKPQTYEIPLGNLKDDVYISAYCMATCDIDDYQSETFDEDYHGYSFGIEKYDIVAADDGMKFVIDRNLEEDNKVSSIFVITKNDAAKKSINYEMQADKIYIYLPTKIREKYDQLKVDSKWNDIFFSMIAIPVLTSCFSDIKSGEQCEDLTSVIMEYRWFKSIIKSYKKETGKELDWDVFNTTSALEMAQTVFNYSSAKGLTDFCDMVINGGQVDEQD